MLECRDIDALMMDWLYDELESGQARPFDAHLERCARCKTELASLERTRLALRDLPDEDPPPGVTQILLHEAAKSSPRPVRAAATPVVTEDDEPGGFFGWVSKLLSPIILHPGAAAVATLILVAGVAGSLYLRGDHEVTTARTDSTAATSETLTGGDELGADMMRMPDENADNGLVQQPGFAADIAEPGSDVWRPAEKAGEEEKARDLKKQITATKEAPPPPRKSKAKPDPTANAVSGTDMLVDAEDTGGVLDYDTRSNRSTRRDAPPADEAPAAPESTNRYRAYKDGGAGKDQAWAASQKQRLDKALQLEKCNQAARIANDILDRNPDYYYRKVDRSKELKPCSGFVAQERKKRAAERGKRRAAKPSKKTKKKSGGTGSDKAKAAPRTEDAYESAD